MANADRPHGFRPVYAQYGEHGSTHDYQLTAANALIRKGDILVRTSDGLIDRAAAGFTQGIGVAAANAAASSGATIPVYDNPGQVFEAQCDDTTGILTAQTGINLNADILATANTAAKDTSNMEIDESTGNTTATLPLTILRLYPDVENSFGQFNRLEVLINRHALTNVQTTGV